MQTYFILLSFNVFQMSALIEIMHEIWKPASMQVFEKNDQRLEIYGIKGYSIKMIKMFEMNEKI